MSRKKLTKVLTFGTFDVFHKGHEHYLNQARKFGDYLIVVIARDKTVEKVKGKQPLYSEKARLDFVKKSGLSDEVVLGRLGDKYAVIEKYQPDVICLGYDQTAFIDKLAEKLVSLGLGNVKIKRLKAYKPEIYKSSKIKNR